MGEAKTFEVGDYDKRGQDFDTYLLGPVTDSIIDADRLVRLDFNNGMPNWALYRACLAGDTIYLGRLRRWAVAFSVAYCTTGGVKESVYSEELACVAAWDALNMLVHNRQLQPYTITADALGVHHKTYARLRRILYARMRYSLYTYWDWLGAAIRAVKILERKAEHQVRIGKSHDALDGLIQGA